MTNHKLTAGDGYQYLIRQVAAVDTTARGRAPLIDYYSAKGESPGRWIGSGLRSLSSTRARWVPTSDMDMVWAVPAGSTVTEAQMKALFGEGLHPNADAISAYVTVRGVHGVAAAEATKLGRRFHIRDGETTFARALAVAYRNHNEEAGLYWNAPIAAPTRAAIRTALARDKFGDQYGRAPADDRELSGFIARESRGRTTAVAGYDFTYSPVKSVSALWAIAPLDVAAVIEQCHDAAVADALAWQEANMAFTRSGTNGVAQLDTTGLIGAAFTHRDSRAGDPDLHTHVAISNKVAAVGADGVLRWLALDGQPVHRYTVAASELYNTRLEAHLGQRLGLRFADVTPQGRGKRPVREIVGMSTELMTAWSSRRMAIEARTAELSKQFQATHRREPTHVEMIALTHQATLETREAKHEPRSLAEQRQTWRTQAIEELGGARELTTMLGTILSTPAPHIEPIDAQWITKQAAQVITTVAQSRATWQRHHVFAEVQRVVRGSGHAADHALAEHITDTALAQPFSLPHIEVDDGDMGEPQLLRRRDGTSVYSRHGSAIYTSKELLAAERRIVATAHQDGGRVVGQDDIKFALADSAARGKILNDGQVALVRAMAGNGRRLALALAPAGTGKTTAMAALSHAWRSSGGNVLGLAPTATAAIELRDDLCAPTDTIAKYVWSATPGGRNAIAPWWFNQVGPDTLIIIDEAGKAGTLELDAVITHAAARGASIRLVGDDRQLASISAGGVLRDIATETDALTLAQLVRFASTAESAATLAIRAGDPAGLGYYIDHQRVHVGTDDTATDMAYTAWAADLDAGRDSILLAPTNDIVDTLNARARLDRLAAANPATLHGREIILSDQLAACPGDLIRTRRNSRTLRMGRTDYVRNGYRFHIVETHDDGSIKARHLGSGQMVRLPAKYVTKHVTLGYAATIDSTQGLTAAHASHIVGAGHLTRQLLYVALTRGRQENHIYLSTAETDPHRVLSPKATHPETAVDVLTKTLARDDTQTSATTAQRQAADPFTRLGPATAMYYDALGAAAEHRTSPAVLDQLQHTADHLYPGLTRAEAWPVLRRHLAIAAADGRDPITTLTDAVIERELHSAHDPAAVIDWRIDPTDGRSTRIGPLRWLPKAPAPLAEDPQWGHYLTARAELVADLAEQIRASITQWTPATAPAWAKPVLAANPKLAAEIAVFRAAHDVPAEDTRVLGPPQYAVRARTIQRLLQDSAQTATRTRHPDTRRFEQLVDSIDPRVRTDSHWPQLVAHLSQAAITRPDLPALVRSVASQRSLPDELPAAALWWRLAAELTPTATLDIPNAGLRPPWIPDLHSVFGSAAAETVVADPAWPGLVSAISAADPTRWTPSDLLHVAAEHLSDIDPERTIPAYEYARAITYTVDLLCSDHHDHADHFLPEQPPLHPDEEEQLPPDPRAPRTDLAADTDAQQRPGDPPIDVEPPPDPEIPNPADDLGNLQFEHLSTTRAPAPPLPAALLDVYTLRIQYQQARADHNTLRADVLIGHGPAIRQATPRITELRQRADADRPYMIAIQDIIAEWSGAEAEYEDALNSVEWARTQLHQLQAQPDADALDFASAKLDIKLRLMTVPEMPPAQRYQSALRDALTARATAAGGTDNIVSSADVDRVIADVSAQDDRAVLAAREHCRQLRRDLDRAEAAAARAFAEAETRSAEHIVRQRAELDIELRVLAAAGRYEETRPLRIPATAVTGLPGAGKLRKLAALPFTVTPIHATTATERTMALHTLHAAAAASDRTILWCSPSEDHAKQVFADEVADIATTTANAYQQLRDGHWQLPAGSLLVIDHAATADPAVIADLAEHAADNRAGLILIDTTPTGDTWPPNPSARLLRLLQTELPWSLTLATEAAIPRSHHPHPPDRDSVLTQTRRLAPHLRTDELCNAVMHADRIRSVNTAAYQRHLNASWLRHHHTLERRTPEAGLNLADE